MIFLDHPKFRKAHRRAGLPLLRPRVRFKGSSGTNTVTQQSGPPAQVLQNYSDVYAQGKNVAQQPSQPYTGQLLAGFTPEQQAAFSNIDTAVGASKPYLDAAGQYMTNAGTMLDPSNFGGTVSAYQSPYTQQVVNATQNQFNNQNQIAANQMRGNAVSAGAFGGDREGVAQAVLAGQQQTAQAPVIAGLYNTGFQNATQAAQANAWLNSQTGFGMANLGNEAQQLGLSGANAQLQAGSLQQQMAQQQLNIPYQQYQAAQAYPYQMTNWLEGLATGTGSGSGGTSSTTSPGPSTGSQVAGLGLTGLAGYNMAKNAGWFGQPSTDGGVGMSGVEQGAWDANRGGEVAHRAPGGGVGGFGPVSSIELPDVSVNEIPTGGDPGGGGKSSGLLGGSSNLLGGGGNLMGSSTGSTSTTSGGGGDSTFGSILKTAGQIAASVYGGPAGGMAAGYLNSLYHINRGGGIEEHARRMARGPTHRPRGYDGGGEVTPGLSASVSGNPGQAQMLQQYAGLPDEQLREMAVRYPPNSPQGKMVQQALQHKMTSPQSAAPQAGLGPVGGEQPQTLFARGGDVPLPAEDDEPDAVSKFNEPLPEMDVPQAGPSVPGGITAGLTGGLGPVPAERHLEPMAAGQVPAAAGRGGYKPPPPELAPKVEAAAAKYGIDPKAFAWMLSQESGWNPKAYNASSDVGGLGQFKRATAAEMGITDRMNPDQAIEGSAKYLRQLLNKSGGNYERAIGHYGTFSTGLGPQADAAVRGKFRSFMGGNRGGAVELAEGGGAYGPDGDPDEASLPRPDAIGGLGPAGGGPLSDANSGNYGDDWSAGPNTNSRKGAGQTIPSAPPEAGSAQNDVGNRWAEPAGGFPDQPKQGGLGPVDTGEPSNNRTFKSDPWESVLAAGLGMMSGKSPHALVNIGAGGLAGLTDFQKQRQLSIQDQLRSDTMKTNAAYRQGILGIRDKHETSYGEGVAGRTALQAAQAKLAEARADKERNPDDWRPTGQVDENGVGIMYNRRTREQSAIGPKTGAKADTVLRTDTSRANTQDRVGATTRGQDIRSGDTQRGQDIRSDTSREIAGNRDTTVRRGQDLSHDDRTRGLGIREDSNNWRKDASNRRGDQADARLGETQKQHDWIRAHAVNADEIRMAIPILNNGFGKVTPDEALRQARVALAKQPRTGAQPPRPSATPPASAPGNYIDGETYVDAKGRRALYKDGNFVPAP